MEEVTKENETDRVLKENENEKIISKRQFKKQKKAELYQLRKIERRKQERLKRKAKRAEKVSRNEYLGPSKKKLKQNTMKDSLCRIAVAVDCSFDDLMTDKDITKLCQQLSYCYAKNRRAVNPVQLHLTSLSGRTKQKLEQVGFKQSWDVNVSEEAYGQVFGDKRVVYLSSESENVLEDLEEGEVVYVIGGLVDHNHHKGLCLRLAEDKGVQHAQLPIKQFLQLSSRNVLTVNHVFEILLRYTETKVWGQAFDAVVPKRKIIARKEGADDDGGGDDDDDGGGGSGSGSGDDDGAGGGSGDDDDGVAGGDDDANEGNCENGDKKEDGKKKNDAISLLTDAKDAETTDVSCSNGEGGDLKVVI